MFRILKIITIISIISIIASSSVFLTILWKYSPELPSYNKILEYKPDLSSRLYSSDGILLKSYHRQERIFIPIERIPTDLKNAFLSSEDKKFFKHSGIDMLAIVRAGIINLISLFNDQKLIGASTITQQVVKNLLLTNEVSFERKIKEILLAIRVENILTKNQILELYLNDIYLGYKSYGVAADAPNSLGHPNGVNLRYGWPAGEYGGIPIEGGVAAAYRREIENAPDPEAHRTMIEDRLLKLRSPFRAAFHGDMVDLIDPRETRYLACKFVKLAQPVLKKLAQRPKRTVRP